MQIWTCICIHASLDNSLLNSAVFRHSPGIVQNSPGRAHFKGLKWLQNVYSPSLEAPRHFSHWPLPQNLHCMQVMLTEKQYTNVLLLRKAITTKNIPFKLSLLCSYQQCLYYFSVLHHLLNPFLLFWKEQCETKFKEGTCKYFYIESIFEIHYALSFYHFLVHLCGLGGVDGCCSWFSLGYSMEEEDSFFR